MDSQPTQEREQLTEARHQGLPLVMDSQPTHQAQVKNKRQSDSDSDQHDVGQKRPCRPDNEDNDREEEMLITQESEVEPGGNKFFTPGESGGSQ